MGRIVFFEPECKGKPSALAAAFLRTFPEHAHHSDYVATLESVVNLAQKTPLDAVVYNWDKAKYPLLDLEEYWQNGDLALVPLVIAQSTMDRADEAFLQEYGHEGAIKIVASLLATSKSVFEAIVKEHNEKLPGTRARQKGRRFFAKLHAGDFDEAEHFLEGHGETFCTANEKLFYRALVFKMRKQFDGAVGYLTQGFKATRGQKRLAAKFLHLIGNVALKRARYDQAVKFLDAANKMSPKNLRRRFLLAQAYLEHGDHIKALAQYSVIYKLCPVYPGIHVRMAELLFAQAESDGQVAKLSALLPHVNDRELVNLTKRLVAAGPPDFMRQFLDLVIREFSIRANRLIEADDFYAALKPYKHIEKIVGKDDRERQQLLAYCYARLYYRAADFDLSAEHLNRAISLSSAPSEKLTSLKALLDKARGGAAA